MTREMKDSGIEWVHEIPKSWNVIKGKYLFTNKKQVVGAKVEEYKRLALTLNGVIKRSKDDSDGLQPDKFDTYQILRKNELVFKLIDLQNISTSRVGLSPYLGIVSPAYIILKANKKIHPQFSEKYYLMMWMNQIFNILGDAGVRSSLNAKELLELPLPLPALSEQKKIADYLDKKCAEISSIVTDIQKQIEVLEQYKHSTITEAVTKGLNPNAEMKDSGIRYIGMIPSHWETKKGKFIFNYIQKSPREDDGVITCFRDGEVTLRSKRREDGFTISEKEIGYQGIDIGDLVVHGMDGFAGAIGISDSRGKASPVLNVLETEQNKRYYMYLLRTMAFRGVFESLSTGIRVRTCDTNWGKLREIFYILPSHTEQKEIADYLDKKCAEIEAIISDKKAQLDVIEKYKRSLIYEYVTGKKEVVDE
ncbi:MAG: restriction endonuclease subunit S [Alphaproteobacteria bacterium]|nr:restriction endonuclease subunit S [Alphaproteobacteria bacterium]